VGGFIPPLACKEICLSRLFFFLSKRFPRGLCGRLAKLSTLPESSTLINFFEESVGLCGRDSFLHSPVRKSAFRGFFSFPFEKINSKGILWEAAKLSTPPGSFLINFSSKKKKKEKKPRKKKERRRGKE
jgi:hypothetical protein